MAATRRDSNSDASSTGLGHGERADWLHTLSTRSDPVGHCTVGSTHKSELLPLIHLWRESFLTDDRVPVLEGNYKLAERLRSLARKFIAELARQQGLGLDGREML
jgi:hypothetical protein